MIQIFMNMSLMESISKFIIEIFDVVCEVGGEGCHLLGVDVFQKVKLIVFDLLFAFVAFYSQASVDIQILLNVFGNPYLFKFIKDALYL